MVFLVADRALELRARGGVRSGARPGSSIALRQECVDRSFWGFLDLYHVDDVVRHGAREVQEVQIFRLVLDEPATRCRAWSEVYRAPLMSRSNHEICV